MAYVVAVEKFILQDELVCISDEVDVEGTATFGHIIIICAMQRSIDSIERTIFLVLRLHLASKLT